MTRLGFSMIGGTLAVRPEDVDRVLPAPPTVVASGTTVRCSFCRREPDRVATMITGDGVAICDACVEHCQHVLHQAHRALRAQVSGTTGAAT